LLQDTYHFTTLRYDPEDPDSNLQYRENLKCRILRIYFYTAECVCKQKSFVQL